MGPINSYLAGEVLPTTQCYVAREDFGNKKKNLTLLKLSLAKPRYNAEAASKSCELYIHGDTYY